MRDVTTFVLMNTLRERTSRYSMGESDTFLEDIDASSPSVFNDLDQALHRAFILYSKIVMERCDENN